MKVIGHVTLFMVYITQTAFVAADLRNPYVTTVEVHSGIVPNSDNDVILTNRAKRNIGRWRNANYLRSWRINYLRSLLGHAVSKRNVVTTADASTNLKKEHVLPKLDLNTLKSYSMRYLTKNNDQYIGPLQNTEQSIVPARKRNIGRWRSAMSSDMYGDKRNIGRWRNSMSTNSYIDKRNIGRWRNAISFDTYPNKRNIGRWRNAISSKTHPKKRTIGRWRNAVSYNTFRKKRNIGRWRNAIGYNMYPDKRNIGRWRNALSNNPYTDKRNIGRWRNALSSNTYTDKRNIGRWRNAMNANMYTDKRHIGRWKNSKKSSASTDKKNLGRWQNTLRSTITNDKKDVGLSTNFAAGNNILLSNHLLTNGKHKLEKISRPKRGIGRWRNADYGKRFLESNKSMFVRNFSGKHRIATTFA